MHLLGFMAFLESSHKHTSCEARTRIQRSDKDCVMHLFPAIQNVAMQPILTPTAGVILKQDESLELFLLVIKTHPPPGFYSKRCKRRPFDKEAWSTNSSTTRPQLVHPKWHRFRTHSKMRWKLDFAAFPSSFLLSRLCMPSP